MPLMNRLMSASVSPTGPATTCPPRPRDHFHRLLRSGPARRRRGAAEWAEGGGPWLVPHLRQHRRRRPGSAGRPRSAGGHRCRWVRNVHCTLLVPCTGRAPKPKIAVPGQPEARVLCPAALALGLGVGEDVNGARVLLLRAAGAPEAAGPWAGPAEPRPLHTAVLAPGRAGVLRSGVGLGRTCFAPPGLPTAGVPARDAEPRLLQPCGRQPGRLSQRSSERAEERERGCQWPARRLQRRDPPQSSHLGWTMSMAPGCFPALAQPEHHRRRAPRTVCVPPATGSGTPKVGAFSPQSSHLLALLGPSRRRDCHSAAPPSPSSGCFSMDGEGISVKWQSRRWRALAPGGGLRDLPRGRAAAGATAAAAAGAGRRHLGNFGSGGVGSLGLGLGVDEAGQLGHVRHAQPAAAFFGRIRGHRRQLHGRGHLKPIPVGQSCNPAASAPKLRSCRVMRWAAGVAASPGVQCATCGIG